MRFAGADFIDIFRQSITAAELVSGQTGPVVLVIGKRALIASNEMAGENILSDRSDLIRLHFQRIEVTLLTGTAFEQHRNVIGVNRTPCRRMLKKIR